MPFVWAAGAVWSLWEAYQLVLYLERKNLVYYVSDWDRFMQKMDEDPAFAQEMKEVLMYIGSSALGILVPYGIGKGYKISKAALKKQLDKVFRNKKGKQVTTDGVKDQVVRDVKVGKHKLGITKDNILKDPTGQNPDIDLSGMTKDQQKMAMNFLYKNVEKQPTASLFGKIRGLTKAVNTKAFKRKSARHGTNRTIDRIEPKI